MGKQVMNILDSEEQLLGWNQKWLCFDLEHVYSDDDDANSAAINAKYYCCCI